MSLSSATRLLTPLVAFVFTACGHVTATSSKVTAELPAGAPLQASPRKYVGRIFAIDADRGFAIVDLTPDPPPTALVAGTELIARTDDLRETGRLQASQYLRSRVLGTKILSGKPSPGDEVVIFLP